MVNRSHIETKFVTLFKKRKKKDYLKIISA